MELALDDLPILQICSVKGPRHVRVESWSNDEVAHQKLPSTLSFEAKMAKPGHQASVTKASRSSRTVRLEASHIGGELAREVEAADMNNLQAAVY